MVNQTGQASVVVGGLVRQGDSVLLVKQQKRGDPELKWALPGGYVEHGESLFDALRRELCEETSLNVLEIGPLLYGVHLVIPDARASLVALVFQIETWCGQAQPSDLDGADETILDAQFVPVGEAVQCLEQGYRFANQPAIEYLCGHSPPGAVWVYHGDPIRGDRLVECAPGGRCEDL